MAFSMHVVRMSKYVPSWLYMYKDIVIDCHKDSKPALLAVICGVSMTFFIIPAGEAGGWLIKARLGNLQESVERFGAISPSSWFPAPCALSRCREFSPEITLQD